MSNTLNASTHARRTVMGVVSAREHTRRATFPPLDTRKNED